MVSNTILRLSAIWLAAGLLIIGSRNQTSRGQEMVLQPGGEPRVVTPEMRAKMEEMRAQRGRRGQGPPNGGPNKGDEKPEEKKDKEEKPEEKKDEGKKEESGDGPIERPDKPSFSPDPAELDIKPDEDGKVTFSFRGQQWPDVLNWLAGVSGMSLDWQKMPGDHLNLTTHRAYTLDEARNLINRHLLSRGYTLLPEGEILHLVKLDQLDPSLVPAVSTSELDNLHPYTIVKTTFDLPKELKAEEAVEDVKQLLSKMGQEKVKGLAATNRIFALDAVANLRDIREMIAAERAELEGHIVPETFRLHHARAEVVVEELKQLLGMSSGAPSGQMDPRQMQQMMQKMQQAAQKAAQQKGGGGGDIEPETHMVAIPKHNIIMVNAAPRKLEIIRKAIEVLDSEQSSGEALLGNMHRMRRYRLASLDPETVVTTLQEIGNLDPRSHLRPEKKTKTIIAYATLADHVTIQALVDKLDGSGRSFHVEALRRMPAEQVAGTIKSLYGTEEEDSSNSRRGYYSWYRYGQEEETDDDKFRIEADVERNLLLLWATEAEMEEVYDLLVKLGERPDPNATGSTTRILEAGSPEQTRELLERLQQSWGRFEQSELDIELPEVEESPEPPPTRKKPEEPGVVIPGEDSAGEEPDPQTRSIQPLPNASGRSQHAERKSIVQYAQLNDNEQVERNDSPLPEGFPPRNGRNAQEERAKPDPIKIRVTKDGRIEISSDDPSALNRLENMILDLTPPPREYKVFRLKNADAFYVSLDLEDFFADEMDESSSGGGYYDYIFGYRSRGNNNESSSSLGRTRKLTFVADSTTNTIIVRGASNEQLAIIDDLIKNVYDAPTDQDNASARRTMVVKIKYSSADAIGTAIKEVYRDLLSSKDKAFEGNKQQQNEPQSQSYVRIYDYSGSYDDDKKPSPVRASFDGALSIGIDKVSNTLVISAQEELIENVVKIAKYLDEEAKPNTVVATHKVQGGIDAKALQAMLSRTLAQPWQGGKPPQQQGQQPQGEQGKKPQEGGEKGEGGSGEGQQNQR